MNRIPTRTSGRLLTALVLSLPLAIGLAGPATAAAPTPAVAAQATAAHLAPSVAAVAKPKITSQPVDKTVLAGKLVTFKIAATGSALKYQWYVLKPGTSTWVKSNRVGTKYETRPTTSQNATQYKVVVTNSAGKVTSSVARLKVLSTVADPVARKTAVWFPSWRVSTVATSNAPWTRIKAENRYNEPAPKGYEYVLTRFQVEHRASVKLDPAYTLDFKFVTKAGKTYKSAVVITPDDLFDVGKISSGKVVTFMVAVAVPKAAIKTGVWEVTDFRDYRNRQLGYFQFL